MSTIPKVILLVETSRAFGRELLYGIARYSRSHGPWTFYKETGGLERSISKLKNWGADGIIMRNPKRSEELTAMGLPTILVIHRREDNLPFPRLITDGVATARVAAEHMLDRGFRNFAFCGFDEMSWSTERADAFSEYLQKKGFQAFLYRQPKSKSKQTWDQEQPILVQWLKSLPKPVAVFACNDDRALHVTEACKTAGLDIPEEVAVIGVDNDELVCDLADPPITSIALDTEMAGYRAAEMLDRMMQGQTKGLHDILVNPTHVITRRSTDIMAINDPEVAQAIRFIRSSVRHGIRVDDVAEAAALSRRVLEKRFRQILNRSVHEEIRRVRIDQIVTMLLETDLSIAEIAFRLGFPGVEHIARYFRKEKSMSPQEFRKIHAHRLNERT
ncbi:MAG: DNA-binding transcriptional regulator [Sedimentisphaerales bacterium]|nr:DNA-binding transcriptional regulator [Sedimentisphaerales bacterium]